MLLCPRQSTMLKNGSSCTQEISHTGVLGRLYRAVLSHACFLQQPTLTQAAQGGAVKPKHSPYTTDCVLVGLMAMGESHSGHNLPL